jgi:hypothetical protein
MIYNSSICLFAGDRLGCFNLTLKGKNFNMTFLLSFLTLFFIQVIPSVSSLSRNIIFLYSSLGEVVTQFEMLLVVGLWKRLWHLELILLMNYHTMTTLSILDLISSKPNLYIIFSIFQ